MSHRLHVWQSTTWQLTAGVSYCWRESTLLLSDILPIGNITYDQRVQVRLTLISLSFSLPVSGGNCLQVWNTHMIYMRLVRFTIDRFTAILEDSSEF